MDIAVSVRMTTDGQEPFAFCSDATSRRPTAPEILDWLRKQEDRCEELCLSMPHAAPVWQTELHEARMLAYRSLYAVA